MTDYEGCSDGACILRLTPLHQHTNGGCRCLRDIPTPKRIAIKRKIDSLKQERDEARAENDVYVAQFNGVGITPYLQRMSDLAKERDEAREAARWVFDGGDDMSSAMKTSALQQWPWLEETE